VDYTGFSTINSQRFGHRLVDRVANPPDVLAWQKQPQRRAKPDAAGTASDEMDNLDLRMMPEALDQVGPAPSPHTLSIFMSPNQAWSAQVSGRSRARGAGTVSRRRRLVGRAHPLASFLRPHDSPRAAGRGMGRCEDQRLVARGLAHVARGRAVGAEGDEEGGRPQERIESLISEHLPQKLEILSEKDLTLALESFVNKVRPPSHAWRTRTPCSGLCTLLRPVVARVVQEFTESEVSNLVR
jgi:hypothetical protein